MLSRKATRIMLAGTLLIGAGLFIWLLSHENPAAIIDALISFGLWPFLGFVALSMLNFSLYSLRWQLIVNRYPGITQKFSLFEMYRHRLGGFAASYLTPAAQVGGEPVRIALLVSDKVKVKQATGSVIIDITFELIAYISFIIAGVLLAIVEGVDGGMSFWLIGIVLGIALIACIGFLFSLMREARWLTWLMQHLPKSAWAKKLQRWVHDTEALMHQFFPGRWALSGILAALSFIMIGFRVVEAYYIAHFFGVTLTFAQAFLISTLPGVALLIPVPGSIGVFEGSFATIFALLGVGMSSIAFAMIIRSRDLIFIILGALHAISRGALAVTKLEDHDKR